MNKELVIACMDFNFIGGSMGSVVGEKIARAIDHAIKKKVPFLMISKSGGARMMEAALSLMQLAKTSTKLARFSDEGGLYIPILTDPTTGGVTASYGMLGDIIFECRSLDGMADAERLLLAGETGLPGPGQVGAQRIEFCAFVAFGKVGLKFKLAVEMVFDDRFVAPGDKHEMLNAGLAGLIHRILDQGPVHHRQHFLGHGFGGGQEPGAKPGHGKNRCAHFFVFHSFTSSPQIFGMAPAP